MYSYIIQSSSGVQQIYWINFAVCMFSRVFSSVSVSSQTISVQQFLICTVLCWAAVKHIFFICGLQGWDHLECLQVKMLETILWSLLGVFLTGMKYHFIIYCDFPSGISDPWLLVLLKQNITHDKLFFIVFIFLAAIEGVDWNLSLVFGF